MRTADGIEITKDMKVWTTMLTECVVVQICPDSAWSEDAVRVKGGSGLARTELASDTYSTEIAALKACIGNLEAHIRRRKAQLAEAETDLIGLRHRLVQARQPAALATES